MVHQDENKIIRIEPKGEKWLARTSSQREEIRSVYFVNRSAKGIRWDRAIAKFHGLNLADSFLVHFYSDKALGAIRDAESNQLRVDEKTIEDVSEVHFEILKVGEGFAFKLKSISYGG